MKKQDFCVLWQQDKQLKITEVSEVWLDAYDEGDIHQFQSELTH